MNQKIGRALRYMVLGLFLVFLIWLTVLAGTSTACITPATVERTYLVEDSIWLNLLIAGAFLAALYFFRNWRLYKSFHAQVLSDPHKKKTVRRSLLLLIGLIGATFVVSTQKMPLADQYWVVEFASYWRQGDFGALVIPGGYLEMFPNQWGLVYFMYLLTFIFGDDNYIAFQLLNVLALVWFYHSMFTLADDLSDEHQGAGNLLLLLGVVFLPLILYTSFIYGTMLGLALSAAALVRLSRLVKHFTWRGALVPCLMMAAAIIMKQNYMIFALGYLIVLLIYLIDKANWKLLFPCLGLAAALLFSGSVVRLTIAGLSQQKLREDSGVSSLSFVAMGLQENTVAFDGWWNYYNSLSYVDSEYSSKVQSMLATQEIQKRLDDFAADPMYAVKFISGKNASQWNNPDFQCFWINQEKPGDSSKLKSPGWINRMLDIRGTVPLDALLNRLQFLILAGTVLYMMLHRHKGFIATSIGIIVFGGFLFHCFWEAKAQYTLPYFVMMFPLSTQGWIDASDRLTERVNMLRRKPFKPTEKTVRSVVSAAAVTLLLAIIQSGIVPFFNDTVHRAEGTADYRKYLLYNLNYTTEHMDEGFYYLSCAADPHQFVTALPSEVVGADIGYSGQRGADSQVYLSYPSKDEDRVNINFEYCGKRLDVVGGKAIDLNPVWAYAAWESEAQRWRILKTDVAGEYCIYFDANLVLTLNPEDRTLSISTRIDSPYQRWRLITAPADEIRPRPTPLPTPADM